MLWRAAPPTRFMGLFTSSHSRVARGIVFDVRASRPNRMAPHAASEALPNGASFCSLAVPYSTPVSKLRRPFLSDRCFSVIVRRPGGPAAQTRFGMSAPMDWPTSGPCPRHSGGLNWRAVAPTPLQVQDEGDGPDIGTGGNGCTTPGGTVGPPRACLRAFSAATRFRSISANYRHTSLSGRLLPHKIKRFPYGNLRLLCSAAL